MACDSELDGGTRELKVVDDVGVHSKSQKLSDCQVKGLFIYY